MHDIQKHCISQSGVISKSKESKIHVSRRIAEKACICLLSWNRTVVLHLAIHITVLHAQRWHCRCCLSPALLCTISRQVSNPTKDVKASLPPTNSCGGSQIIQLCALGNPLISLGLRVFFIRKMDGFDRGPLSLLFIWLFQLYNYTCVTLYTTHNIKMMCINKSFPHFHILLHLLFHHKMSVTTN